MGCVLHLLECACGALIMECNRVWCLTACVACAKGRQQFTVAAVLFVCVLYAHELSSSRLLHYACHQGFVRSTTKYWVPAEDVSSVKYHILQHLPVFQFEKDDFAGDAQLINSVYFDNENLELYHGRLDKKPNAIALRIR